MKTMTNLELYQAAQKALDHDLDRVMNICAMYIKETGKKSGRLEAKKQKNFKSNCRA